MKNRLLLLIQSFLNESRFQNFHCCKYFLSLFLNHSNYSLDHIEKIIEDYILKKFKNSNVKKISLALSGGVDSTLVLAFLKKTLPDLEKVITTSMPLIFFGDSF